MQFYKLLILTTCLTLFISPAVSGEYEATVKTSSTSMNQVTQRVLQRQLSSEIEIARQGEVTAGQQQANSWLSGDPSVFVWHRNDAIGSDNGFREWEGSFVLPLWLSGQKQEHKNYAQQMMQEIPALKQRLLLDASGQVREAIWEVKVAETRAQSSWQNWKTAEQLEKDVASHVKHGDMAFSEELLAKTHTLGAQGRYLARNEELEHALLNYKVLTGEDTLPAQIEESLQQINDISAKHPVLAMYDVHISTLRAAQNLARYDGADTPSILVGAHTEQSVQGAGYDNSISLGINIPFSNEAHRAPAIAVAGRALTEAEVERLRIKRSLERQLLGVIHSLETQQQQLTLAEQQQNIADEYLQLQQKSFELGEIDLMALIGTQIIANQSRSKKAALEITVQQSIARVNQASGITL